MAINLFIMLTAEKHGNQIHSINLESHHRRV